MPRKTHFIFLTHTPKNSTLDFENNRFGEKRRIIPACANTQTGHVSFDIRINKV